MRGRTCSFVSAALLMCMAVAVSGVTFAEDQPAYVGNSQCKMCHNNKAEGEPWAKWKASKHATSYASLSGDEAKAAAEKKGVTTPPAESPECLRCHVTGYKIPEKGATPEQLKSAVPEKIVMADGIQCETCHGPASLHVQDGKKFKMQKDTSIDMSSHITKKNDKICTTCHNDQSPSWKPEEYTLADGKKAGFDFEQAYKKIEHKNPTKAAK